MTALSETRALLSVVAMVTLAPVAAVATLVCWDVDRWGGSLNPLGILVMAVFGLFTVPMWPTYIPAIFLTPAIMKRVARLGAFQRAPILVVSTLASATGAFAGVLVISIIVPWGQPLDLILNWITAGGVSGALTLPVICLIYRIVPATHQEPDQGMPPVISDGSVHK